MDQLKLDYRLDEDCIKLGYLDDSLLLLMNNALVPWIILIPNTASEPPIDEFDLLPRDQQIALLDQINHLSRFLRSHFQFDKLNIATIGNIVRQLHIHIVARSTDDYCWPGVVWGNKNKSSWNSCDVIKLIEQLTEFLPDNFQKPTN